ncbi:MAG: hypothetical protein AAF085_01170 [Planctomycetota bacterium]
MLDDNTPPEDTDDIPAQQDIALATDNAEPEQAIDFDLHCVRCDYNLRGTLGSGRCPECGEPVASTLRPDLLHMSRPDWLDRLRKGMNWLVTAIVMNIAMIPIGMVIGFASVASNPMAPGNALPMTAMIILGGLGFVVSITYGVGVWFVTTPESDVFDDKTSRSIARWLILPAMLISVVADLFTSGSNPSTLFVGSVIDFISSVMLLVGLQAGLWYLRLLANRIPEPSLAKQTMTVFWGLLVSMSLLILATMIIAAIAFGMSSTSSLNPPMAAFGLLMCPLGLALLVFFIWWIVLMFRYRTRFTQAYEIALSQQRGSLSPAY